jgi:hypothetical protein
VKLSLLYLVAACVLLNFGLILRIVAEPLQACHPVGLSDGSLSCPQSRSGSSLIIRASYDMSGALD